MRDLIKTVLSGLWPDLYRLEQYRIGVVRQMGVLIVVRSYVNVCTHQEASAWITIIHVGIEVDEIRYGDPFVT